MTIRTNPKTVRYIVSSFYKIDANAKQYSLTYAFPVPTCFYGSEYGVNPLCFKGYFFIYGNGFFVLRSESAENRGRIVKKIEFGNSHFFGDKECCAFVVAHKSIV